MYETSGSRVLERGVGTQIETTSHSASRAMSVVASSSPDCRSAATSSGATSRTWECPPLIDVTTDSFTSKPMTRTPPFPASTQRGRPTYPSPITPKVVACVSATRIAFRQFGGTARAVPNQKSPQR